MQPETRNKPPCYHLELPITDYHEAWQLQIAIVEAKNRGILKSDVILSLEHASVYTLGRRGGIENLTISKSFLEKNNISIVHVERGGNITYHGPGQLVVYPILDLNRAKLGISDLVSRMEDIMILTAGDFGVVAGRNQKNRGIWVGNNKLGSIGIAVRKGISFHGFALNVNPSLTHFEWINPCGLTDIGVTSLEKELGVKSSMKDVRKSLGKHLEKIFRLNMERITKKKLASLLSAKVSVEGSSLSESKSMPMLKNKQRKPPWLKRSLPTGRTYEKIRDVLKSGRLHTVCQEAKCPNLWECFSNKTATFLILGDRCTRNCGFCAVEHGPKGPPDPDEPARVAEAVRQMNLAYVVITSVTRDDLPDGGSAHFVQTIQHIRHKTPDTRIEVLIPDFQGDKAALDTVLNAHPDVINHNMETVKTLYSFVRPQADYDRSLYVIRYMACSAPHTPIKSGLMLGLGETRNELIETFENLVEAGCRMLTMGQYLQPSKSHLDVIRYVPPSEFNELKDIALRTGFGQVASAPFVRSSYHAKEMFNPLHEI
jgi:lipoic acid synthetase